MVKLVSDEFCFSTLMQSFRHSKVINKKLFRTEIFLRGLRNCRHRLDQRPEQPRNVRLDNVGSGTHLEVSFFFFLLVGMATGYRKEEQRILLIKLDERLWIVNPSKFT